MKDINKIILLLCGTFLLTACGQKNRSTPLPNTTETPLPVSETAVPEAEEPEMSTQEPRETKEAEEIQLGSAQTTLLDTENDRVHNILLAADTLSGYTLEPGEEFSFNRVLGDRTEEAGYRKATVIIEGEKSRDYGGGVCQVSSTLYQAVRDAGLTVLERHSHKKPVDYAQQGDDAAVNYGTLDFRFQNQTDMPVILQVAAADGLVTAAVYQKKE